jgi:hypothetical protein
MDILNSYRIGDRVEIRNYGFGTICAIDHSLIPPWFFIELDEQDQSRIWKPITDFVNHSCRGRT